MPHHRQANCVDIESQAQAGARVASRLADAIPHGPHATLAVGRSFTNGEVLCGLSFLATVMEIASVSSKTLTEVQKERGGMIQVAGDPRRGGPPGLN